MSPPIESVGAICPDERIEKRSRMDTLLLILGPIFAIISLLAVAVELVDTRSWLIGAGFGLGLWGFFSTVNRMAGELTFTIKDIVIRKELDWTEIKKITDKFHKDIIKWAESKAFCGVCGLQKRSGTLCCKKDSWVLPLEEFKTDNIPEVIKKYEDSD